MARQILAGALVVLAITQLSQAGPLNHIARSDVGATDSSIASSTGASDAAAKATGGSDIPTSASASFSKVTEAPSGVSVLSDQQIHLPTASIATTCSSNFVPLQTSFWVKSNQVDLIGDDWFKGKGNLNWTFFTNTPGVAFGTPFIPGAQDSDSHVAKVPFKVTNQTLENAFDISIGELGGNAMMWQVVETNGTILPDHIWNNTDQSKFNNLVNGDVLFELSVVGYGVCPYPIQGNSTCRNGKIDLSPYNWMAYQVDNLLKNWTASKNNQYSSLGLMEDFKNDFGIQTDVCSVQKPCPALQSCSNQANPDADQAVAVYLAYSAMSNLANFFNMLYSNVLTDGQFNADNVAKVTRTFFPDPNAKYAPDSRSAGENSPLSVYSAAVGLASFGLMAVPEVGPILGGIAGLIGGGLGLGALFHHPKPEAPKPTPPPPPSQFADAASLTSNVHDTIVALQSTIEQWQWSTLSNGTNFLPLFEGGSFVNRSLVEFSTTQTSAAAAWLDSYLTIKLINYAWWTQNVFIAFMPYQDIHEWSAPYMTEDWAVNTTKWTKEDCEAFASGAGKSAVYMCDTADIFANSNLQGGGMARLAWYSKSNTDYKTTAACNVNQTKDDVVPYLHLGKSPVGFDQHPSFTSAGGQYNFNALDVVNSSLRSYIAGGYNYDFANDQTAKAASAGGQKEALAALAGLQGAHPSDAGMFNLPIVIVEDMWYWPEEGQWGGWDAFSMVAQGQADHVNTPLVSNTTLPPDFLAFCNTNPKTQKADICKNWH